MVAAALGHALFPAALAARMMLLVHPIQPIERQVRVNLRGRNIGVAEDGLHRAQVGAVLHHVGGATVAQHVRAGMTRRLRRRVVHHLPHPLPRDRPCPARDEQERRRLLRRQHRTRMLQILLHNLLRSMTQRNDALLVAFAAHQHVAQLQLQIFQLQVDDL